MKMFSPLFLPQTTIHILTLEMISLEHPEPPESPRSADLTFLPPVGPDFSSCTKKYSSTSSSFSTDSSDFIEQDFLPKARTLISSTCEERSPPYSHFPFFSFDDRTSQSSTFGSNERLSYKPNTGKNKVVPRSITERQKYARSLAGISRIDGSGKNGIVAIKGDVFQQSPLLNSVQTKAFRIRSQRSDFINHHVEKSADPHISQANSSQVRFLFTTPQFIEIHSSYNFPM